MQQTTFMRLVSQQLKEYESLLSGMNRLYDTYPEGYLTVISRDEQLYFQRDLRHNNRRTQIAIPERTEDGFRLITQLQEKRFIYHARPLLRRNIRALESALKQLSPYDPSALCSLPLPALLPDSFFLPGQLNVEKWIADTRAGNYRTNPYMPEQCKIPTADGHWTRSKSEERWCDILAEESLLYRYECGLRLASGRIIYPDFTVLHPTEKRLVYIEHFGLMDIPSYALDQMQKLEDYADSGLTLGRDLFYTTETKDRPLTRDRIYKVLYRSGLLQQPRIF